jgi:hypothetical protein
VVHTSQYGSQGVHVVVDLDTRLVGNGAKHPTDVLNDTALGPDRKGQEEGVERWTVEALAEQARRRRQDETDIPF